MKPILIIQNCEVESAGTILEYFNIHGIQNQVFHAYYNHDFPDIQNFEAVISLGCPHTLSKIEEHDFLQKLYGYVSNIVRADIPYLGICFGAQILAKVLGAKVTPNKVKEIGIYQIELTKDGVADMMFKNIPQSFQAFQWHGETFKVPFGATLLATSAECTNQAFRKNKAVGIQFHFEADPQEIPVWCDTYAKELKSFGKTKDTIVSTYAKNSEIIKTHSFQFIENFISNL